MKFLEKVPFLVVCPQNSSKKCPFWWCAPPMLKLWLRPWQGRIQGRIQGGANPAMAPPKAERRGAKLSFGPPQSNLFFSEIIIEA